MPHWASRSGHVDVIELLVGHMTNIDSRDAQGMTSLMVAARYGEVQAVKCLIDELIRLFEPTMEGIRYIGPLYAVPLMSLSYWSVT